MRDPKSLKLRKTRGFARVQTLLFVVLLFRFLFVRFSSLFLVFFSSFFLLFFLHLSFLFTISFGFS